MDALCRYEMEKMDRSMMSKRVLIVSPVPLFPAHSGNRKRIVSICRYLKERNLIIDFFYVGYDEELSAAHVNYFNGKVITHSIKQVFPSRKEIMIRALEKWNGLLIRADYWRRRVTEGAESGRYNHSIREYVNFRKRECLREHLKTTGFRYRAVIINYTVHSSILSLFDSAVLKIIDTHDKLTDRYKLFLSQGEKPSNWYSLRSLDEKKALRHADIVWAITDEEKLFYEFILNDSESEIFTLGHLQPFQPLVKQNGKKMTILLTGSRNRLNISGFEWFYKKVWKKITSQLDQVQLMVAGSICTDLTHYSDADDIILYGKYQKDSEVFCLADICVNPMQDGTGLKIKTVEALSFGKPVLSTSSGASGLTAFLGKGLICSDDPLEWQKILLDLIKNEELCTGYSKPLEEMVSQYYTENLKVIHRSLKLD